MKLRILKTYKYSHLFEAYLEEFKVQEYASPFWPLPKWWQTIHVLYTKDAAIDDAARLIAKSKQPKPDVKPKVIWENKETP